MKTKHKADLRYKHTHLSDEQREDLMLKFCRLMTESSDPNCPNQRRSWVGVKMFRDLANIHLQHIEKENLLKK